MNKKFIVATGIVCILPILAGIFLWGRMPQQMASSFDWSGNPTAFRPKWFVVFVIPFMITALHGLCGFSLLKREGFGRIRALIYELLVINCPIIAVFSAIGLYSYALGYDWTVNYIAIGTVFIVSLIYGVCSILKDKE